MQSRPPVMPKGRLQDERFRQDFKAFFLLQLMDLVTNPRFDYNAQDIINAFEQKEQLPQDFFMPGLIIRCGQDVGMNHDEIVGYKEK